MIETGMYVRTTDGIIEKVIEIGENRYMHEECYQTDRKETLYREDILKANYNIIDLIEEGDYVNGYKVTKIDNNNSGIRVDGFSWGTNIIYYENIKSIVTQEQFENMKYEVK